jgi:hypothetical protein
MLDLPIERASFGFDAVNVLELATGLARGAYRRRRRARKSGGKLNDFAPVRRVGDLHNGAHQHEAVNDAGPPDQVGPWSLPLRRAAWRQILPKTARRSTALTFSSQDAATFAHGLRITPAFLESRR